MNFGENNLNTGKSPAGGAKSVSSREPTAQIKKLWLNLFSIGYSKKEPSHPWKGSILSYYPRFEDYYLLSANY